MAKNEERCSPGYEPVEGKRQHEQGSCRPKAEPKLTASEREFREKRAKQLAGWKKQHPGSSAKAAQHLHNPETKPKTAANQKQPKKKTAAGTRSRTTRKSSAKR